MFAQYRPINHYRRKSRFDSLNTCLRSRTIGIIISNGKISRLSWVRSPPVKITNLFCRSAASTVLCATYGWLPLGKEGDGLVDYINDLMHRLVRACLPGAYLVEIFPSMMYLPEWLARWKRDGYAWHRKDSVMFQSFMEDVAKKKVSRGNVLVFLLSLKATVGRRRIGSLLCRDSDRRGEKV